VCRIGKGLSIFPALFLFSGARMSGSEIIIYMTIISLMIVGIALIMDNRPA
jgi:hypothetical protein